MFPPKLHEETFPCRAVEVLWGCGLVLKNADATNHVDHRCEGETWIFIALQASNSVWAVWEAASEKCSEAGLQIWSDKKRSTHEAVKHFHESLRSIPTRMGSNDVHAARSLTWILVVHRLADKVTVNANWACLDEYWSELMGEPEDALLINHKHWLVYTTVWCIHDKI